MLSSFRECLVAFQAINVRGQMILGIVAALIVGGMITIFILASILPNTCVAISTLAAIVGILAERSSK